MIARRTRGRAPVAARCYSDPRPVAAGTVPRGRCAAGDKSISHRYAMLAAIADGTSHLDGYAPGADCAATLACLEALGVRDHATRGVRRPRDRGAGPGPAAACAPRASPLDAANSGTSMRLLSGLAGRASVPYRHRRRRVAVPPSDAAGHRAADGMGATIAAVDGRPPLTIDGADLHAITYSPSEVPSAQVKSAVLLAGLHAHGRTDGRRTVGDAGSYGARARGVRRPRRPGGSVGRPRGRPAAARRRSRHSGRHFVGGVLARAGRGHVPGRRSTSTVSVSTRPAVPFSTCSASAGAEIETRHRGSAWTLSRGEPTGTIRVRGSAPRPFEIDPDDGAGRDRRDPGARGARGDDARADA